MRIGLAFGLGVLVLAVPAAADWPMAGHDAARSGATTAEIRPPFERKWYRLFPDEGLMAGVQPIVSDGTVFVGTLRGVLRAMDAATGKDAWTFRAAGPILHTAAAGAGKVTFGCGDGGIYALNAAEGTLAWRVQTGAAVWNAPLVHDGLVLIGSRDGRLYAIAAESGKVKWTAPTGGPLLGSPALDAASGRAVIGCEDMRVYAFDVRDGAPLWRSEKLPGVSFRGYHPVVAPDGSVMVTVTPAVSLGTIEGVLNDMVKAIFGDMASWRHTKEENERLREQNLRKLEDPGTYEAQLAYLRKRLAEEPAFQTFFVLDGASGKQKFVAPIVYAESMNGPGSPPLVAPDGKVIVKFQALLRSRYGAYSPFLNVGCLDTATGHVAPIMDQDRTYGWHDSLLLVHDEQCGLALAGRVLINTHQDNVNAMDLETRQGYGEPFCRNIHEPAPGEALGIWAHVWRGQPVPVGKEWLARGTAVYGGGSVIDAPVSVAGDSFYYVPTHEINAGAAVIAYTMQAGGTAARKVDPPAATLTDDQWKKVQQMPWDWDSLEMRRLAHVLKALPGPVPGTRQQPLADEAAARVAGIADADLDRFIWEAPAWQGAPSDELAQAVRELIAQDWQPLVFPAGKHPMEAYRLFTEPTETLYTLALAWPHLDPRLQADVRQAVARMSAGGGPLDGPVGQRSFKPDGGAVRSAYDVPDERLMRVSGDITRSDVARLYPLWLWAHVSGDWTHVEKHWKTLSALVSRPPNKPEEDCHNGHLAGLFAFCRMAARMKDAAAVEAGVAAARQAMRERLVYELAHTRGGLITQVPQLRTIFGRWRHLTPDVGRFLAAYAGPIHQHLVEVYVDYHRPAWWLAWNVELTVRNECPFSLPTMPAEIFAARALVLAEPADRLKAFVDLPWCRADLFHIQKLALCTQAGLAWKDMRQ